MQYRATFCNIVQYFAALHNIAQYCAVICSAAKFCRIMQYCTGLQLCAELRNRVQKHATLGGIVQSCTIVQHWKRKSIETRSREKLRDGRDRVKIGSGRFLGRLLAPKSVPNASQERLSSSRERLESPQRRPGTAKKASRTVREHAEAAKIDAESRPEAKKSGIVHASRSRSIVGPIFCQFGSIFNLAAKPVNP